MYRHLLFASALLLATSATARDGVPAGVPEGAYRDLWCGLAFTLAADEVGGETTPLQQAVIPRYTEGATMLIERAAAGYRQAGRSEQWFATHSDSIRAGIAGAIASDSEPYSLEECSALLDP